MPTGPAGPGWTLTGGAGTSPSTPRPGIQLLQSSYPDRDFRWSGYRDLNSRPSVPQIA